MSIPEQPRVDSVIAQSPRPPADYPIAFASRGDALSPYLLAAIARRFRIVGEIDPELSVVQRYTVAAATFRPNRSRWVERFYKNGLATQMRTANAVRAAAGLRKPTPPVLQVHALFSIPDQRTVIYIDCTHAQSASLWPAWNPLRGRALQKWYDRERATYTAAQHLFAFSEVTKASLVNDYGMDPAKVTVTGAGVNFFDLPELPTVGSYHGQEPPTILFIGNDFVRKGGLLLIEAFRRVREVVPNARLQLVGLDPEIAPEPGVEVLGRISDRERIAELYQHASVFTTPSIFEPYSLVTVEAMAFGLPVVGTRQMAIPEIITDGVSGVLVEPSDAVGLADALIRLLKDPDLAKRMGAAARRDVESRLTWDAVVDRMAPVLERLSDPAAR